MTALTCDKCKASILAGARFCGQCGDPVTELDLLARADEPKGPLLATIQFRYSQSPNYSLALDLCRNTGALQTTGSDRAAQHELTLPVTEPQLLMRVWELVSSWKSSALLIAGRPATRKDFTFGPLGCYQERQLATDKGGYCSPGNIFFGCHRLGFQHDGGDWLKDGTFDRAKIWNFDKAKMRARLSAGIEANRLCPALNVDNVWQAFEAFPMTIDAETDPDWNFKIRYVEDDRVEIVGVRPVYSGEIKRLSTAFKHLYGDIEADQITEPDDELEVGRGTKPRGLPRLWANIVNTAKWIGIVWLLLAAAMLLWVISKAIIGNTDL
jgi:hypothetical protein